MNLGLIAFLSLISSSLCEDFGHHGPSAYDPDDRSTSNNLTVSYERGRYHLKNDTLDVIERIYSYPAFAGQTATLIYLHWASGNVPLMYMNMAPILPPYVRGLFPMAKSKRETSSMAFAVRRWFQVPTIPIYLDDAWQEDEMEIDLARNAIHDIINMEVMNGISPRRIMLGGLGQGGSLALYSALTYPSKLAGVLAHNCYLPMSNKFQSRNYLKRLINLDIPVLHTHGMLDSVLPSVTATDSVRLLTKMNSNYNIKYYKRASHTPNRKMLKDSEEFISKYLPFQR